MHLENNLIFSIYRLMRFGVHTFERAHDLSCIGALLDDVDKVGDLDKQGIELYYPR
jgi:hypothetical protein